MESYVHPQYGPIIHESVCSPVGFPNIRGPFLGVPMMRGSLYTLKDTNKNMSGSTLRHLFVETLKGRAALAGPKGYMQEPVQLEHGLAHTLRGYSHPGVERI